MGTQKYVQQEKKFTQQELQAAPGGPPASRIDGATTLSKVTRAQSECVFDFFEAGDRLPAEFEESSKELEINRKASAARRLPSVGRAYCFEESLYWLLSAATLVYLLLGIIGH